MKQFLFWIFSSFLGILNAQVLLEKNPSEIIKTIVFKTSDDDKNQFPIVRVNQQFTLQFDDLSGREETYYYRITHCNSDWSASQLIKSEYIKGVDEQPLHPDTTKR